MPTPSRTKRKLLTVIMDGIGLSQEKFGNAVACARTPNMAMLARDGAFTRLVAHGTAVGLPSDADIGNSEVGHNALGGGRIFDQGAKLVQAALASGAIFEGLTWQTLVHHVVPTGKTLHLIGLLSDGNVHSNEQHLYAMLRQAKRDGVQRVRVHPIFDGRDVGQCSAEIYLNRLEQVIYELKSSTFDLKIASGGGRMEITMDRYEADWNMVQRGWNTHVHGQAPGFPSARAAVEAYRKVADLTDQYFPAFVITDAQGPVGRIEDGDSVIFFNFRGDRAIEISRAFTEIAFTKFDRGAMPKVLFAGMMEYDGDLKIPPMYLVTPPAIDNTLSEYLITQGVRQFACSETQKYGHMTYFWNGNRSGYFDQTLEEYLEIPSDNLQFDLKPWMKAFEVTEATIERMRRGSFDFGRINFPNGDMVGHTGNFEAAVIAVETVDLMLHRLRAAATETNTILVVTADHGNADEMFDAKSKDYPNWDTLALDQRPRPKTAHTLNPVPFYVFDPSAKGSLKLAAPTSQRPCLGNLANTVIELMGLPQRDLYLPSLIQS